MKIEKLILERYGAFTDRTLSFDPSASLHVVLGPNEAGKTSALHAIYDLLFGFGRLTPYDFIHEQKQLRVGGVFRGQDGTVLHARRRKGNKNTLFDELDRPLNDDCLRTFLGNVTLDTFRREFGLTATAMRAGGDELLRAGGKLAETLAAGSAGMTELTRVRADVEAEADGLFTSRRVAGKAFYQLSDAYSEADKALRDSITTADAIAKAKAAVAAAEQHHADLTELHSRAGREFTRLKRLNLVRPKLQRLDEIRQALESLAALPHVADSVIQIWQQALDRETDAQRDLARIDREQDDARRDMASIIVDEGLLAHAATIEQLNARIGEIAKDRQDLPGRRAAQKAAQDVLAEKARALGLSSYQDLIAKLPNDLSIAHAREQVKAARSAEEKQTAAEADLKAARREHERLAHEQSAHPHLIDPSPLQQQMRVYEQIPVLCETERREQAHCRSEQTHIDNLISRLSPAIQGADQLVRLPLPDASTVTSHERMLRDAADAEARAEALLKRACDDLDQAERELAQFASAGHTVTFAELAAARDRRDIKINEIKQALTKPDQFDLRLNEVRHHVRETDRMADQLTADSGRAAKLAALEERRDEAGKKVQLAKDSLSKARSDSAHAHEAWVAVWRASAIEPLQPSDMQRWLNAVADIRHRLDQLTERRISLATLMERIEQMREPLAQLLSAHGAADLPDGKPVEVMHRELALRLTDLQEQWTSSRARMAELKRAERDVREAEELLKQATDELDLCRGTLPDALSEIGLLPKASLAQAEAAINLWQTVAKPLLQFESEGHRVAAIEADVAAYTRQVVQLAGIVAPDLASQVPEVAAAKLREMLAEALQQKQRQAHLKEAMEGREQQRRAILAAREADASVLADARQTLKLDEATSISDVLARLIKRNELERQCAQASADLSHMADGFAEDVLRAELAATDLDTIESDCARLAAEQERLMGELQTASVAIDTAKREKALLEQGRDAAKAAQTRVEAVAGIKSVVERWLVRAAAAKLASRAIEKHRAVMQDPLLERAGSLFAMATAGHFSGLAIAYGADDQPSIVATRSGGGQVEVIGLSEGTRDQLYLAMRLALLEQRSSEPLPFIGDDLLASFDERRTESTLQLLANVGAQRQVILFTHHAHVADLAMRIPDGRASIIELQPATRAQGELAV